MRRPGTTGRRPVRRRQARAAVGVGLVLLAAASAASAAAPPRDPNYYPTGIEPPALPAPALSVPGLVKVGLLLGFAAAVFYVTDWALLDVRFVGTRAALWGVVVLGAGAAGLAAALAVPVFYLGLPLGIVLFAGGAVAYAMHRNALVTPALRVLTAAHAARLLKRLRGEKPPEVEAGPVTGAGRQVVFMGLDDLPRRLPARSPPEARAAREVERVIHEAIVRRASALGLVARKQKGEVRYRIDGQMVAGPDVDASVAEQAVRAVKRLADLDPDEARKPQDGRLRAVVAGQTFDLRVQAAGSVRGEQVVIRIVDLATAQRRLEDLGLPDEHLMVVSEALPQRPGLVLLSAPKDSGLTTTLHACLRHFDRYVNNVVVFEPRVDLEVENVQHVPLDQEDGPVAVAEVRSRLRMEPDVIGFDSLYQSDVARALAEAAPQRTLVIAVRAIDTAQAVARLAALFGSVGPLAGHLQVVVNQRLVRLLCPDCKEPYRPNPEFLRKANLGTQRVDVLYRPASRAPVKDGRPLVCPTCHNGRYVGRTGLFEVMPVDEEARALLAEGGLGDLRTFARKRGMRNLQEEGLRLVTDGRTSVEEVLRVVKIA